MTRRSVRVERDGQSVNVDERIADLLAAAWSHGVRTQASSVHSDQGVVLVAFETPDDATRFLNLVTSEDAPDLPDTWTLRAIAENRAGVDGRPDTPDHAIWMRIKFPAGDLPAVTATARAKPVHSGNPT